MLENDIEDFIVVSDDPFPLNDRDAKLYFDIAWKSKTSKLIINCRDISRKERSEKCSTKIISLSLSEFQGIHSELCAIEPKISPYFPVDFTFKTIIIERPNTAPSWGFFSSSPAFILEEDREFTEECILDIQNYLRAVVEICGQQLLLNVLFKEENISFFEDKNEFIVKKSNENIKKAKIHCLELLKCHNNYENLQGLTEELYKDEDCALERLKETIFDRFLICHTKLNEDIENLIEELKKLLVEKQCPDIGPRVIDELNGSIVVILKEYYCKYKESVSLKLDMSKSLRSMYSNYVLEMLKDKSKYEAVIFRDCVGTRLKDMSLSYHYEMEQCSHFNLILHSSHDLIVDRKIQIIQKWESGQEMIKPTVRHEDYSLIQLKNLNHSNIDLSLLEDFYFYINEAYKLLIEYYEARRVNISNQSQIIDDPINVISPAKPRKKALQASSAKKYLDSSDSFSSIDLSGIFNDDEEDSGDEFQDALDEANFERLKNTETKILKQKEDLENELKKIAAVKAELRNSQSLLKRQYEKLKNKAITVADDVNDSLSFASLHPEKVKSVKKLRPIPGSSLSSEQRKEEARKANDRIKNFKKKLKIIPEEKTETSFKDPNNTKSIKDHKPSTFKRQPIPLSKVNPDSSIAPAPTRAPPPPPNPPPVILIPPPPPPPPPIPPSITEIINSRGQKGKGSPQKQGQGATPTNYMDELALKLAKRRSCLVENNFVEPSFEDKSKQNFPNTVVNSLSSKLDSFSQFVHRASPLLQEISFEE